MSPRSRRVLRMTVWAALLSGAGGCSQAPPPTEGAVTAAGDCARDQDCAGLDDDNACNGRPRCRLLAGRMSCTLDPAEMVFCDNAGDTACKRTACVPATGQCETQPAPPGTACTDGDPCTPADACVGGACMPGPLNACECREDADCADREDGDACNGTLYCDHFRLPWRCSVNPATVVKCSGNAGPCAIRGCDPARGKCVTTARQDGAPCDDGDSCTAADTCQGGTCAGVQSCACKSSADCAAQEDGDACNGVLYCDPTSGTCKLNPATVVACSDKADTDCLANICHPKTGACAPTPVAPGTPCDDGNPCTQGETCLAGACLGGSLVCTCKATADCAAQDDGDHCNGELFCDAASGTCVVNPATVVVCPTAADTDCAKSVCLPKTGTCTMAARAEVVSDCKEASSECAWKLKPAGEVAGGPWPCDDDDACTAGETCEGLSCKPAAWVCGCKTNADCAGEDDGDLCNGTWYCDKSANPPACKHNPATVVKCSGILDTGCAKNTCDPKTGQCVMTSSPDGAACDDGEPCSKGDTCSAGQCAAGQDICACHTHADCAGKDDGDLCNGVWYCDMSGVLPSCAPNPNSSVFCNKAADTACVKNTCQPATGLCAATTVTDGAACDDGDPCTAGDACKAGLCAPGTFTCACKTDADCLPTDDGDLCNGVPYCDHSAPKPLCAPDPSSAVFCPQSGLKPCVKNACQPKTGQCLLGPALDGTDCDDGEPCTVETACAAGACLGKPAVCDDGDPCTTDSCAPAKGCLHAPKSCADGNACTLDACDPKTGQCQLGKAVPTGTSCNADGNGCTVGDTCKGTSCSAGPQAVCQGQTGPCQAEACVSKTADSFTCALADLPDGSACDDPAACMQGALCKAGKCQPGAAPRFFVQDGPAGEASWWRAVAERPDQGLVLAGGRAPGQKTLATHAVWRVVGTDRHGKHLWVWEEAGEGKDPRQEAVDVFADEDGTLFVAGQVRVKDGSLDLQLARLTSGGSALWKKRYHLAEEPMGGALGVSLFDATLVQMIVRPGDGIVLAGNTRVGSDRGFFTLRTDADGGLKWKTLAKGPVAQGAVWTSAGQVLMHGTVLRESGLTTVSWTTFDDETGGQSTILVYGMWIGEPIALPRAVELADGRVLVARWRVDPNAKPQLDYWMLDGKGTVLAERSANAPDLRPTDLAPLPDGRLGMTGRTAKGEIFAGATDAWGNVIWTRTFAAKEGDTGLGVTGLADGGLAFAGRRTDSAGVSRSWLLRAGPWGHESCAAAGACKDKALESCDDGKVCTADLCEAKSGCVQVARDDNYCEANDGCSDQGQCDGGQCKPGHHGAKSAWFTDMWPASKQGVIGLQERPGGQQLALFHHPGKLHRWQYGGAGGSASNSDLEFARRAVTLPDQGVVVAGWSRAGPSLRVATFARHGSDFQQKWVHRLRPVVPCASCETEGMDAAVVPGGGLRLLARDSAGAGTVTVAAVDGDGAPLWVRGWGGPKELDEGVAIAALDDASVVVAGRVEPAAKSAQGLVLRLSDTGWPMWARQLPAGQDGRFEAVVQTTSRALVATGWRTPDASGPRRWTVAWDLAGNKLWEVTPAQADASQAVSIVAEPYGGVTLAGHAPHGGKKRVFLSAIGPQGQVLWHRQETTQPVNTMMVANQGALLRLQGGGYLVGVGHKADHHDHGTLQVMPWGFTSCQKAGKCIGKPASWCDDGEACTADHCDAAKGCVHTPISGAPCGAAGLCAQGACKAGACGNAQVDAPLEVCDGQLLPEAACAVALGVGYSGTPSCASGCTFFDTAQCAAAPGTAANPAPDCQALAASPAGPGTGSAFLDADGPGPEPPALAVCDVPSGWRLVHDAPFDEGTHGWSGADRSACGPWGLLLGGYKQAGKGAVLSRALSGLPPHKELRVAFRAVAVDSWDQERAVLKVDGATVWTSAPQSHTVGEPLCGGTWKDRELAGDKALSHKAASALVQFTSDLDDAPDDESLGLFRVTVWVR